jgi:hypothetical protein
MKNEITKQEIVRGLVELKAQRTYLPRVEELTKESRTMDNK